MRCGLRPPTPSAAFAAIDSTPDNSLAEEPLVRLTAPGDSRSVPTVGQTRLGSPAPLVDPDPARPGGDRGRYRGQSARRRIRGRDRPGTAAPTRAPGRPAERTGQWLLRAGVLRAPRR